MTETCCYMIITAKIHDREAFLEGYSKATAPLVATHGGRYVMRAPGAQILEGDFAEGGSVAISEWPSREVALGFWNSAEYAEAKKLREGLADVFVVLIDAPKINQD